MSLFFEHPQEATTNAIESAAAHLGKTLIFIMTGLLTGSGHRRPGIGAWFSGNGTVRDTSVPAGVKKQVISSGSIETLSAMQFRLRHPEIMTVSSRTPFNASRA